MAKRNTTKDIFSKSQLSAKRVRMVLHTLGVSEDKFRREYGKTVLARAGRARKDIIASLKPAGFDALATFLRAPRTKVSELACMGALEVKSVTTLDRYISAYAAMLVRDRETN